MCCLACRESGQDDKVESVEEKKKGFKEWVKEINVVKLDEKARLEICQKIADIQRSYWEKHLLACPRRPSNDENAVTGAAS